MKFSPQLFRIECTVSAPPLLISLRDNLGYPIRHPTEKWRYIFSEKCQTDHVDIYRAKTRISNNTSGWWSTFVFHLSDRFCGTKFLYFNISLCTIQVHTATERHLDKYTCSHTQTYVVTHHRYGDTLRSVVIYGHTQRHIRTGKTRTHRRLVRTTYKLTIMDVTTHTGIVCGTSWSWTRGDFQVRSRFWCLYRSASVSMSWYLGTATLLILA